MHSKILWLRSPTIFCIQLRRSSSSSTTHHGFQQRSATVKKSPLAVLPTKSLLYSVLFTSIMSSPLLVPCLGLLKYVIESKSSLIHPSRNPLMRYFLRKTIYNHFCAGENEAEVRRSVQKMKSLGYKGVTLGYARESVVQIDVKDPATSEAAKQEAIDSAVDEWKEGNLRTLRMIGVGDCMNVKYVPRVLP